MEEIDQNITNDVVSFEGNFFGHSTPILLNGTVGSGKTALALLMSNVFGSNIAFITTDPRLGTDGYDFNPDVTWDQISAVVVDELNGWERKSLITRLPPFVKFARENGKGVILIAQDASEFMNLIPTDTYIFGVSVVERNGLIRQRFQSNLAETGSILGRGEYGGQYE